LTVLLDFGLLTVSENLQFYSSGGCANGKKANETAICRLARDMLCIAGMNAVANSRGKQEGGTMSEQACLDWYEKVTEARYPGRGAAARAILQKYADSTFRSDVGTLFTNPVYPEKGAGYQRLFVALAARTPAMVAELRALKDAAAAQ